MTYYRRILLFVLAAALLAYSCGKKKEAIKDESQAGKQVAQQDLVTDEEIPYKAMIEGAGFEVTVFKKFPSQEQDVKGRVLLYSQKKKKGDGGIIYFKKTGSVVSPAWHWHFDGFTPDSIHAVEINEDGLWDIRVTDSKNNALTFIQEETFTLAAKPREDFIALNGASIPPALPGHELWRCFDGDTATAWQAALEGKMGAALELTVPFGVVEGILIIETAAAHRPKECDVYMGDKKIDELKLENKSGRQLFRLSPSVQGATEIRLVFASSHDKENIVAVAELALK
jgi:hypothetical protein